jgi:hypothetical protein
VAGAALAAGCPAESGSRADAALEDARPADADPLAPDAPPPYRHTILIDGVDDFTPDESFPTTTASYGAYLTWDGEQLFVGCSGPDAAVTAPDAASKWFFVYLDTDPGTGLGAYLGEQYNTQQPGFPTGFAAEFYLRWKGDDTLIELESFAGAGQWNVEPVSIERAALGTFREAAIPLAALDHPGVIGVTTLMMNEKPFGEWSYAGLFTASFTDGYYDAAVGPVPASRYLEILLASSRLPGDPAAERP